MRVNSLKIILLIAVLAGAATVWGCATFDGENGCRGGSILDNPTEWSNRDFQTPPRGDPLWREEYQDYNLLQGYVQRFYSADRKTCDLKFFTKINPRVFSSPDSYKLLFKVGDSSYSDSNAYQVTSSSFVGKLLSAEAQIQDPPGKVLATLTVDPLDFVWKHPTVC